MPERLSPRFEPIPLRLLSLTAQFDAAIWPTLAGLTFTNSTGTAVLQRHVAVRPSDCGWTFTLLNGTQLIEPADPLVEAATQVMNVLLELRSMCRGVDAVGPADV
ncbi:hypothetical protein [Curtobacterium sp. MCBD17_030]|uniref:hypothetical protein n=1 Tax=Curtobacterium sp. MCBD17_030 TaxID=2175649 RepID=UPI000D93CFCD|nr:hypothetical protein [Curtobacterium sp. MCBD17_030]PYY31482.1 hypothetical protein DEI89_17185 [Curtobacterium sp. MCBD17_030]